MRRIPLNRQDGRSRRHPLAGWLCSAAVAVVVAIHAGPILAQQQAAQQVQIARLPADPASEPTTGGASVETATDALGLIQRANNDLQDGQLESAVRRLMYATERFGSSLIELESGVLVPTTRYVDRVVAGWAADRPDALAAYRRLADAEALGVLGGPVDQTRDAAKLEAVVERYLLSSIGDEAAYRLACHWIDRGRFADAATLLQRLLRLYPDPTVDRRSVMVRLALAQGRSGAAGARDRMLARLGEMGVDRRLRARLRSAATQADRVESVDGWPMAGGGPDRLGTMPPLDPAARDMPQDLWATLWSHQVETPIDQLVSSLKSSVSNNYSLMTSRASMNRRWREQLWRPTFSMASRGGRLCFVAGGRLHAVDAQTGMPAWEPIANEQASGFDRRGRHMNFRGLSQPIEDTPSAIDEVLAFGDRVMTDLSIVDRTVYFLQPRFGFAGGGRIHLQIHNRRVIVRELYDANRLVAVDLSTGKVRWARAVPSKQAPEDAEAEEARTRIVVAPVPAGDRLLTVAEDDGDLYLVGLSREDGRLLWRRFLCSAGESFAPPWARVGLAVDGQAAFVATNRGLMFAADASSGRIRWASRYPRTAPEASRRGRGQAIDWTGHRQWDDGHVVPVGQRLIVTAADGEPLLVFDRFSGELTHEIEAVGGVPVAEMRYIAGATPDSVVLGGPNGLAAIDPQTLKLQWHAPMPEGAVGRAAFTTDRLYAPVRGGIVELERETGRRLAVMPVSDAIDQPVGNLFVSDGHLFGGVGDRLTALGNARLQVERLSEAAEAGETDALAARARLLAQLGQTDKALTDLRTEFRLHEDAARKTDAASRLIALLTDRALAEAAEADRALAEAAEYAQNESQRLRVRLARAEAYVAAGRRAEAVELYHALAMAEPIDPMPAGVVEGDGGRTDWFVRPDLLGRRELMALIEREGDASTRRKLEQLGRPMVDRLLAEFRQQREAGSLRRPLILKLERVAALHPGTGVAADAIDALAEAIDDRGVFSVAEMSLRELVLEQPPETALGAMTALAGAYERRGWHRSAATAYGRAWRLATMTGAGDASTPAEREGSASEPEPAADAEAEAEADAEAAKQPEPAVAEADDGAAADEADPSTEPATETETAAAPAEAASPAALKARSEAILAEAPRGMDRPPYQTLWSSENNNAQLLSFTSQSGIAPYGLSSRAMPMISREGVWLSGEQDGARSIAEPYGWLARHALIYVPGTQRLTAKNARTGETAWVAPLPRDVEQQIARHGHRRIFNGGYDGQILAMATPSRSFAIDMVTGKRLWTKDRPAASGSASRRHYVSNRYDGFRRGGRDASVGNGLFAEVVGDDDGDGTSELIVRDIRTGDPRWRRDFSGRQFWGLEMLGDRIGVLIDGGMTAVVLDAATGRRLHRFEATQANNATWRVWTPHGLATQDSRRRIVFQPLDPDRAGWTYDPGRRYIRSWQLVSPRHILVLWHDHHLTLLDLKSERAEPVFNERHDNLQYIYDAAMDPAGKRLMLAGSKGSDSLMLELDAETGKQLNQVDLGRRRTNFSVNAAVYPRSGRLVPALVPKDKQNNRFQFRVFNLDSGKSVENKPTDLSGTPIAGPTLKDGVVLVVTQQGVTAIGGRRDTADGSDSSDDGDGDGDDDGDGDEGGANDEGDGNDGDAPNDGQAGKPEPAKPAAAKGMSIKSKNGQVIVRVGDREARVDVEGGARVRIDGGNVIINGKAYPLKPADGDKGGGAAPKIQPRAQEDGAEASD